MKIALSVGHSILKNGLITSADGIINEYIYCKSIAPLVEKYLKKLGADVTTIFCPEKKFITKDEERPYKLNIINNNKYDLVVELHLNAFGKAEANGTEVYFNSEKGKVFSDRVQKKLSIVFSNRGVQKKDNLYILNQTNCTAILLELFFCTNKTDVEKGKDSDKIARLVAEGIMGKELINVPTKTITPESSKEDILWLQKKLNIGLRGVYVVNEDGVYAAKTRIAVLLFWESKGWGRHLKDDGTKLGKSTIDELNKY